MQRAHFLIILQVIFDIKKLHFTVQYFLDSCVVLILFEVERCCVVVESVFETCFRGSNLILFSSRARL